jgi:hypothetical protein
MEGTESAASEGIFLIPLARVCFDGMQLLSFFVALRMNVILLRHLHYGNEYHSQSPHTHYGSDYFSPHYVRSSGLGDDMCFFGVKCETEVRL